MRHKQRHPHAQEAQEPASPQLIARVKIYKLGSEGHWQDRGTGHISLEYLEQSDSLGLVVVAEEEDGKALLVHRISDRDIYQRQGETSIITWTDADVGTDVAISFQDVTACDHIWSNIKQLQQDLASEDQHCPRNALDDFDQDGDPQFAGPYGGGELPEGTDAMDLPAPDVSNLQELVKILTQASPLQRDRIAAGLLKPKYISALLQTFKQCEALEDTNSLGNMFCVVKLSMMLNDASVLDYMLKDEFIMDVVGALEYDPELSQRQPHRDFLSSNVVFKEVVPITDPTVLSKIHQTYRIQYIKDVILPRALDDATYATLTSLVLFNNVEVVSTLYLDAHFLPELFLRLEKYTPADEEWRDLVAFLQEFCTLCRHLPQSTRQMLFNKLVQLNLYDVLTRIMKVGNEATKMRATDILSSIITHDCQSLRNFLLKQADNMLFGLLVRELTEGSEGGLPEQVIELLKMLVDPETMDTSVEKNEFLKIFYDKYANKFLAVILSDKTINGPDGTRTVPACTLGTILEILCFCVQHHAYRIKYFTLRSHMVEKVLKILRRRERWLVCSALRFLRVCINTNDEFFIRHLVSNNVFEPVMVVFFENQGRYNLIDSCILDTVNFIQKSSIKQLIDHLVEQYGHKLNDVGYVDTFKRLRLRYEQLQEGRQGGETSNGAGVTPGEDDSRDTSRWSRQGQAGSSGREESPGGSGVSDRSSYPPSAPPASNSSSWMGADRDGAKGGPAQDRGDSRSGGLAKGLEKGGRISREQSQKVSEGAGKGVKGEGQASESRSDSESESAEDASPEGAWMGLTGYGDDDEDEEEEEVKAGSNNSTPNKRKPELDSASDGKAARVR